MPHTTQRTAYGVLIAAALLAALPASAVEVFVPIEPCRIYDTREAGDAPALGNTNLFAAPTVRAVTIQGNAACPDIPATGVTAIAANLLVTEAESAGFLAAFPHDVGFQNTSQLWIPEYAGTGDESHFARDNGAIVPIDSDPSDGDLGIAWQSHPLTADDTFTTHVAIDVTGYFVELEAGTGLVASGNGLAIDTPYQLPQAGCTDGEVVTSDGAGGWTCEGALGGGGAGFDKSDIYVADGGGGSTVGEFSRTASCLDANDIALSGYCHSTGTDTVLLRSQNTTNFNNTGAAATFTCNFVSQGPNGNGQANIVCVTVP